MENLWVSIRPGTGKHCKSGCRRLGESPAALLTFTHACFTFRAPLLGLFTARHAVTAKDVGGAQVKEHGKVGRGVAGAMCKIRVVEFVTAMGVNTPFTRALGHNAKHCALATRQTDTETETALNTPHTDLGQIGISGPRLGVDRIGRCPTDIVRFPMFNPP